MYVNMYVYICMYVSTSHLFYYTFPPVVSVSFQQASYSLSEAVSTPLRVCLQLFGSLEIPVSVILSTQNGTAIGESVRS